MIDNLLFVVYSTELLQPVLNEADALGATVSIMKKHVVSPCKLINHLQSLHGDFCFQNFMNTFICKNTTVCVHVAHGRY